MKDVESLMLVEARDRLKEMSTMKPTDEGYKATAEVTFKLIDHATKIKEIEESRKNRMWDCIMQGVKVVVPPAIAVVAAVGLTNYERSEVVTGTAVKEFWRRIFRLM